MCHVHAGKHIQSQLKSSQSGKSGDDGSLSDRSVSKSQISDGSEDLTPERTVTEYQVDSDSGEALDADKIVAYSDLFSC